jgi:uncharacterized membrane protein YhhN
MKPLVKSAVESALIALLVGACCLWFLISGGMADEVNNAKLTLLALGLAASLIAHWTYMGLALKRDGRPVVGWMVGMVLLFPVITIVVLVLMSAREEESRTA